MLKAHPNFDQFFEALRHNSDLFRPWAGDVIRQAAPRWLSAPFRFTGVGSVLTGARWSVKGMIPTIYASLNPDTLNAEAYHKGRRYGWTAADFLSQLRIGMHWQLQRTLNLTDPAIRRALRVRITDLLNCDWRAEQNAGREALTQSIARAAFENLGEGLIVPSARHYGGVNVVFYPSNRRAGSVINVLDPGNLPPDMHGLD